MNNQEIAQELRSIADQVESIKPTVIAYPSNHATMWGVLKVGLEQFAKGITLKGNNVAEQQGKQIAIAYIQGIMDDIEQKYDNHL